MSEVVRYNKLLLEKYPSDVKMAIANVDRCTGTSTGLALHAIGKAMVNKCEVLTIPEGPNCRGNTLNFTHLVNDIIERLGLKYFEVNRRYENGCYYISISYNPFGKAKQVTTWEIVE